MSALRKVFADVCVVVISSSLVEVFMTMEPRYEDPLFVSHHIATQRMSPP
jgi:hypothetical protein